MTIVILIILTLNAGMEAVVFRDMAECLAAIPHAEQIVRESGATVAAVECVALAPVKPGGPT